MKPFKAVEENRKIYHKFPDRNSVHRASAIFPIFDRELYGNNLTFLNHWRVKRNIPEIAARHTIRDQLGRKLGQVYAVLDRPKAYSIDLEDIMQAAEISDDLQTGSWEVEYFSARNMFIPYPAVVQNVYNNSFSNQVHAYARILNDFDEDRAVNQVKVEEASVDVIIDDSTDTFVTIINGPEDTDSELCIRLVDQQGAEIRATVPFKAAPYEMRTVFLKQVFEGKVDRIDRDWSLYVTQPDYKLFYSRLFTGLVRSTGDKPISANHSYYDSSAIEEYFDADPVHERHANMTLPLLQDLPLRLRLYPILSPAVLDFSAAFYDANGTRLALQENIVHWSKQETRIMDLDIDSLAPEGAASVDLFVRADESGKVPTRVTLQVCYGREGLLASSINLSMHSPYVFVPENKTGLSWMEVVGLANIENRIALCHTSPVPDDTSHDLVVTLYRDSDEETRTACLTLKGHAGFGGELSALVPDYKTFLEGRNGFMYVESKSPFLRCLSIQTNTDTGHSSGEHSF